MNFNHFGELLKHVRTLNNISIERLSEGICSTRQLIRIENGENNPSLFILHNLSIKLNMDLQEYYRIHFCSGSFLAQSYKNKYESLIVIQNYSELRELIEEMENIDEFHEGENLQYIFYGKAICSTYFDKDYAISNDYCFKGLTIEDPLFNLDTIKNKIYSNVGLTMINLIASNYNLLNEKDKSCKIFEDLSIILGNQIYNSPFPMYRSLDFQKKLYQSITHNLGLIFKNKKQYDKALSYINEGIELSLKENYMRFLPELLRQKSRLLFKMGDYMESLKSYEICLGLYKLARKAEAIKDLEKEIEEKSFQKYIK